MSNELKLKMMRYRIALLESRDADNKNVVAKLRRKIRSMEQR